MYPFLFQSSSSVFTGGAGVGGTSGDVIGIQERSSHSVSIMKAQEWYFISNDVHIRLW